MFNSGFFRMLNGESVCKRRRSEGTGSSGEGERGPLGPAGPTGLDGIDGPEGPEGPEGETGPRASVLPTLRRGEVILWLTVGIRVPTPKTQF